MTDPKDMTGTELANVVARWGDTPRNIQVANEVARRLKYSDEIIAKSVLAHLSKNNEMLEYARAHLKEADAILLKQSGSQP